MDVCMHMDVQLVMDFDDAVPRILEPGWRILFAVGSSKQGLMGNRSPAPHAHTLQWEIRVLFGEGGLDAKTLKPMGISNLEGLDKPCIRSG